MQERVRKLLSGMYKLNRVPNSILFFGRHGVGKKTIAFEFAKALLCLNDSYPPCNRCASCRYMDDFSKSDEEKLIYYGEGYGGKTVFLYMRGEHPDFIMAKSEKGEIKIDQIRGVVDFLNLKPALSKRKVVVIENAEDMNPYAQNALLKSLEEPPYDTYFLLTTNRINNILPTIKSRCFMIDIPPLTRDELIHITGVKDERLIALAEGSVTRLRLLSQKREILDMSESILSSDIYKVYKTLQKVDNLSYDDKRLLLSVLEATLSIQLKQSKELYPYYEKALDIITNATNYLSSGIRLSLWLFRFNLIIGGEIYELHKSALSRH